MPDPDHRSHLAWLGTCWSLLGTHTSQVHEGKGFRQCKNNKLDWVSYFNSCSLFVNLNNQTFLPNEAMARQEIIYVPLDRQFGGAPSNRLAISET
jgi:hypothetical protein